MSSINDITEHHRQRLANLSDEALLSELAGFNPLPDESDPGWHEEPFELFDHAGHLVALADQIGERHLSRGVGLILDKACLGDPGETMRGLRHPLEAAVHGDWPLLASICSDKAKSPRAGTRLWAMAEVAMLRDPDLIETIRAGLSDAEPLVQKEAIQSAVMLAQSNPHEAQLLVSQLQNLADVGSAADVNAAATRALKKISDSS